MLLMITTGLDSSGTSALLSFTARNVRCYRDEVHLSFLGTRMSEEGVVRRVSVAGSDRPISVLPVAGIFGANASGKSNAIEALRLLAWLAQGNRLDSNPFTANGYRRLRGTPLQLAFRDETHFSFVCTTTHPEWDTYRITLSSVDDELRIAGEQLYRLRPTRHLFKVLFWEERKDRELRVRLGGAGPASAGGEASFTDQVAVLSQIQNLPRLGGEASYDFVTRNVAEQYRTWLSSLVFLDAHPAAMRDYSRMSDTELADDGSNLSGVLYNLCRDAGLKAEILQLVSILPEQEIRDIGFIETPRDEVMVQLTETFGGVSSETDVTLLSDGTLRVLAVAAAVLSAPEGALVVMEELDAGVHPSRARTLLSRLIAVAARRSVRILTTSHDPALLDAVPDDALGGVILCLRDSESGASDLVRLAEVSRYPELIAQGPVGQLMTRGVVERVVRDQTSPEKQRERALAWLEDLRTGTG